MAYANKSEGTLWYVVNVEKGTLDILAPIEIDKSLSAFGQKMYSISGVTKISDKIKMFVLMNSEVKVTLSIFTSESNTKLTSENSEYNCTYQGGLPIQ
ncbi:MAG: hypothetical protein ACOYOK_09725 [Pseudobdellovibrionaceae bacterium]